MENILNLKTYNKYLNLINEGLILVPDSKLTNLQSDLDDATYKQRPMMLLNETHEVTLKAGKKVRITSRGSLRDIEIDGITYDSTDQAACSIYDPYDEYIDISDTIRDEAYNYTFIPIIDPVTDTIRYTISKYSKGLNKYFNPHKVVKAVYSVDNILFYIKDKKDILRKYYFRIASVNMNDVISLYCKKVSEKYSINETFYLAFFYHEEELPFTVGACKDDFYALKDILNKISFKGTTPLKYMIFKELSELPRINLKQKEAIAYKLAMDLKDIDIEYLCSDILYIEEADYDKMIEEQLLEIRNKKGKPISRNHINRFLNIKDNLTELKYYETLNLIWKVKYNEIPN